MERHLSNRCYYWSQAGTYVTQDGAVINAPNEYCHHLEKVFLGSRRPPQHTVPAAPSPLCSGLQ